MTVQVQKRRFSGVVHGKSGQKTVSVVVSTTQLHPKYRKHFRKTRKYLVHDEHGRAAVGDAVVFEECRPLSKLKRWTLVSVVSHNTDALDI